MDSRRFGGAYVLRQLWERLGIADSLMRIGEGPAPRLRRRRAGAVRARRQPLSRAGLEAGRDALGGGARRACWLSVLRRRRGLCGHGLLLDALAEIAEGHLLDHGEPVEPVLRRDLRRHLLHLLRARRPRPLVELDSRERREARREKEAAEAHGPRRASRRVGSTSTQRTTDPTSPRSCSAWPSPPRGSRSAAGPSPGRPRTRRSSRRSRTTSPAGC